MAFVVADIVFVTRSERTDRRREIEGIDHLLARCAKVVRIEAMTPGSDRLAEQLARRGLGVLIAAYDEVKKGYGAFRCTTLPLRPLAG